jgi:dolichol-phosphate mannosyltransferase
MSAVTLLAGRRCFVRLNWGAVCQSAQSQGRLRKLLYSSWSRSWGGVRHGSNWIQLTRFCVVGASGYAVNLTCFTFIYEILGMDLMLAASAAFLLAVINNLVWNLRWTFASAPAVERHHVIRFFLVSVVAFLFAAGVLDLLVGTLGFAAFPAQVLSLGTATPLSFVGNKLWTFPRTQQYSMPRRDAALTTRTWLILPTYNEAENLASFVAAVVAELASATREYRILIVDDSSPDGTGEIADHLAAHMACVEVLHRPRKEGLGAAYLAGFERALTEGAELILEMDADFSHDPRDIPRLVAASAHTDMVVGSRYVAGGGVKDWSIGRRLLSSFGCWYARTILSMPIRDVTGGFKCIRRAVLEHQHVSDVQTSGYGFQVEVTYRAMLAGFSIREVPIVFAARRAGASKMNLRIALEAAWRIPALRQRSRPKLDGQSHDEAPSALSPATRK